MNCGPSRVPYAKVVLNGQHSVQSESCSTTSASASMHSTQTGNINTNSIDSRETSSGPEMGFSKPIPPDGSQRIQHVQDLESTLLGGNITPVADTSACSLNDFPKAASGDLQDSNLCEAPMPMVTLGNIDQLSSTPNIERRLQELRSEMMMSWTVPNFIPLHAKVSILISNDVPFPLEERVLDFLGPNARQVFLLSGQAGSGKTAFCRNFVRKLWTNYKPGDRIPLLIDLPIVDKPQNRLVYKQLQHHNFLDYEICELLRNRQFVLVCDGYDESRLRANLHSTNCLNQPGQPQVKLIVTCRSTFFGRDYQERFYPCRGDNYHGNRSELFEEASIVPLRDVDVETFIQQHVRDTAKLKPCNLRPCWTLKKYLDTFSVIPGLSELVRTPFLLWLALEFLPSLSIHALNSATRVNVTRTQLYDRFLRRWIEARKNRLHNIELEQIVSDAFDELCEDEAGFEGLVLDFLTRLATSISNYQGTNHVVVYEHSKDVTSWKGDFFGKEPRKNLLRGASPLSRVECRYMFLHSSFFAYFRSLAYCNHEGEDDGDSDDDENDPDDDEDDSDDDEDDSDDGEDDYPHGCEDGGFDGVGLTGIGGSVRALCTSYAESSESSGGNSRSTGENSGSSGADGDSSGGNRESTDHQGTSSGGGGSPGGNGSSGEGRSYFGKGRDDLNDDKSDSRSAKTGFRSKKKRAAKPSPFAPSDPFSKDNIFNDPQVMEFLVDRVHSDPRFKKRLLATIDQSKSSSLLRLAAANAITILFMSGERLMEDELHEVLVPYDYLLEKRSESVGQSELLTASGLVNALVALELHSVTQISNFNSQPTSSLLQFRLSIGTEHRTEFLSSTPAAIAPTKTYHHIGNDLKTDSLVSTPVEHIAEQLCPSQYSLKDIQSALKTHYEQDLFIRRISGEELDLGTCFVNLAIVESPEQSEKEKQYLKKQAAVFCRLPSSEAVQRSNIQSSIRLEQLFEKRMLRDGKEGTPQRILVKGRAGIGKTTLCRKLVLAHQNGLWKERFDIVLWLQLRQFRGSTSSTLDSLLREKFIGAQLTDREQEGLASTLAVRAKEGKVLFILDGLDEIAADAQGDNNPLMPLLQTLFGQHHVLITSRPWGLNKFTLPQIDLELETIGFSQKNVKDFVAKVLDPEPAMMVQDFIQQNPLIQGLVNIPVQLDVICFCWDSLPMDDSQVTMARLYQLMARKLWCRDALQLNRSIGGEVLKEQELNDFSPEKIDEMMAVEMHYLGFLAFKGLTNDHQIEFDHKTLLNTFDDLKGYRKSMNNGNTSPQLLSMLKKTSFLHTVDADLDLDKSELKQTWSFLHLTFQEYFAALWITSRVMAPGDD
ncbi:hypothetical protein EC991_004739, partial [Linnemannia zychae]